MAKIGSALILVALAIPLLGVALHRWLFAGVDAPPADFGSGGMFDMIASRYDLVNRVLALRMDVGWRKHMVGLVKERVPENAQLLDVATGTADVALLLAESMFLY